MNNPKRCFFSVLKLRTRNFMSCPHAAEQHCGKAACVLSGHPLFLDSRFRGNDKKRGITIIELTIVLAIMSIFSLFLVNLVMASQNTLAVQHTAVPVRAEAKQTLEAMIKELRAADSSAPGGITIGGGGNSQTITFSVPNQVSNTGTILSHRSVQFSHDSVNKFVQQTSNGVTTILGRNAEGLWFNQPSTNVYTVTLQTQKIITGGTNTINMTLSSEARVRN